MANSSKYDLKTDNNPEITPFKLYIWKHLLAHVYLKKKLHDKNVHIIIYFNK